MLFNILRCLPVFFGLLCIGFAQSQDGRGVLFFVGISLVVVGCFVVWFTSGYRKQDGVLSGLSDLLELLMLPVRLIVWLAKLLQ